MDKERLIKLLMMTTSDNDGEALNAMRMANKMVKSSGLGWEDLLNTARHMSISISHHAAPATRYKAEENWSPPHLRDQPVIDMMFRTILAHPHADGYREFLESVHQWWLDRKSLTQSQYNAIRRAYNSVSPASQR